MANNYNTINQNAVPAQNVAPPAPPAAAQTAPPQQTQAVTPPPVQNTTTQQPKAVQDVSGVMPVTQTGPPLFLYAILAVVLVGVVFFWRRLFDFLKKYKKPALPAEDDGSLCPTCGGTGKVTRTRVVSVKCTHCKGSGIDICHHCSGTGRYNGGFTVPQSQDEVDSFMKCDYCEGTGVVKPPLPCCMCKGKRKEEYTEKYEDTCPTCKGTGRK